MYKGVLVLFLSILFRASICLAARQHTPYKIIVTAPHNEYKVYEKIYIDIEFLNISDHLIYLVTSVSDYQAHSTYKFTVLDENGLPVRKNSIFSNPRLANELSVGNGANIGLNPKDSHHEWFRLSDLYDVNHSGTYTIQAERLDTAESDNGQIVSNIVPIQVTD